MLISSIGLLEPIQNQDHRIVPGCPGNSYRFIHTKCPLSPGRLKRRAGQPTSHTGLTAHRRGSHTHTPPQVAGRDCEPEITLAVIPNETWGRAFASPCKSRPRGETCVRIPVGVPGAVNVLPCGKHRGAYSHPHVAPYLCVLQRPIHRRAGDPEFSR